MTSMFCVMCVVLSTIKKYVTSHLKSNIHVTSAMKSYEVDGKCSIYESALNNELRVYRNENSDLLKDFIGTSALVMF